MESLRCACRPCVASSGQAWLGHALGLSRLTLVYPTPGMEAGFVMNCCDRLHRLWYHTMIAYVLIFTFWLVFLIETPGDTDDPGHSVRLITFGSRAVCACMALTHVVVMSVPRLYESMRVTMREKAVVVMILCTQLSAFDKYYVAKLLGFPDPLAVFPDLEEYTDSALLMVFCIFVSASHFLPVRWYLLVAGEVLAVAMYGLCIFVLGSPERRGTICFFYFLLLVLIMAAGKRQSEVNERLVFSSFLKEKGRRVRAEFRLSQAVAPRCIGMATRQEGGAAEDGDSSSCAQTTATGEAFGGLAEGFDPSLKTIWEIGRTEQWLIDERELVAHPHACLGSGGFGVVIAGDFNGSPAALKLHKRTGSARELRDIGNELRLLRKLRHPNIVLFHGACLSMERHDLVLVMERLMGETMAQFIGRQPAAKARRKCVMDVCLALRYLHSRHPPVAHGDLKPENVIVEGRNGGIHGKLLDFGLARLLARSSTERVGGTYRWMAPGMLRSTVRLGDDVFVFGLIMYFAATGLKPFNTLSDKSLVAYANGIRGDAPLLDWPCGASEVAGQCRPVVDLCMRQRCEERPPMGAVHDALLGLAGGWGGGTGEPAMPPPPGSEEPTDLWQQLSLARHVSAHRSKIKRESQRRTRLRGERPPAETGHLAPVPEDEPTQGTAVPLPDASRYCRHPSLLPTPVSTMSSGLVELMWSWNADQAPDCCCDLHGMLAVVWSLCTELSKQGCVQRGPSGVHVYQCPCCQVLCFRDEEVDEIDCYWCGYDGPRGLHVLH